MLLLTFVMSKLINSAMCSMFNKLRKSLLLYVFSSKWTLGLSVFKDESLRSFNWIQTRDRCSATAKLN